MSDDYIKTFKVRDDVKGGLYLHVSLVPLTYLVAPQIEHLG